jgi:hypothetical protein
MPDRASANASCVAYFGFGFSTDDMRPPRLDLKLSNLGAAVCREDRRAAGGVDASRSF